MYKARAARAQRNAAATGPSASKSKPSKLTTKRTKKTTTTTTTTKRSLRTQIPTQQHTQSIQLPYHGSNGRIRHELEGHVPILYTPLNLHTRHFSSCKIPSTQSSSTPTPTTSQSQPQPSGQDPIIPPPPANLPSPVAITATHINLTPPTSITCPRPSASRPVEPPSRELLSHSTSIHDTYQPNPSFYRRHLDPEHSIHYNSPRGRRIFGSAMASGTLEPFFPLSEQFTTQLEPSYCGLSTLAMSLNAMSIDPINKIWRTPWRWYTDDLLACCYPLSSIKNGGMTFEQFNNLARCHGVRVDEYYANQVDVDFLRQKVIEYCSAPTAVEEGYASQPALGHNKQRYIPDDDFTQMVAQNVYSLGQPANGKKGGLTRTMCIAYSRRTLNQTGDGHLSPVGGYDPVTDSVLIFDVARFKYPPYWITIQQLYDSMISIDEVSGKSRGFSFLSVIQEGSYPVKQPKKKNDNENGVKAPLVPVETYAAKMKKQDDFNYQQQNQEQGLSSPFSQQAHKPHTSACLSLNNKDKKQKVSGTQSATNPILNDKPTPTTIQSTPTTPTDHINDQHNTQDQIDIQHSVTQPLPPPPSPAMSLFTPSACPPKIMSWFFRPPKQRATD